MTLHPASTGTGIVFHRTDIGQEARIRALATNVSSTARSTTLSENGADIMTIEHLMSAAFGMGIDNMLVEIDSVEVPILDGSSLPYVKAFEKAGIVQQESERACLTVKEPFHYKDPDSDGEITILPSDHLTIDLTCDFNSRVLGVQKFKYDSAIDYASEIAPCRTFCFLHELEYLAANGLIKGGDMQNAIVIVEHPVEKERLQSLKALFGVEDVELDVHEGYLNNLKLHFENEIVRHKMLDILGDFALAGAPINGTIIAHKTGHRINTTACRMLLELS